MERSLNLLKNDFISSMCLTPQFSYFCRTFKREFKQLLKDNITDITFLRGHFEISGFFRLKDNRIYYFNIGDLRWDKESMLIRTAEHFKDYTGGCNGDIRLDNNFKNNFLNYLNIQEVDRNV